MSDSEQAQDRFEREQGRKPPYRWSDRDEDVRASLKEYVDHPYIVAVLKLIGGPDEAQTGIYIDRDQAGQIIEWLRPLTDGA